VNLRLKHLAKNLTILETEAKQYLADAGIPPFGGINDGATVEAIERLQKTGREGKRRDALLCSVFTALNARTAIDGIELVSSLSLSDPTADEIARMVDAAFYAGRYSLRTLAEVGARQKASGRSPKAKGRLQKRAARWRKEAEAMGPLSQTAKATIIAKREKVKIETVRAYLKKSR
jgi:hypothetical protein